MERKTEEKASNYQMGADIYRGRIEAIVAGLTEETTDYQLMEAIEEVERLELGIKQNERRHKVFVEGFPINGNDILRPKGGETP